VRMVNNALELGRLESSSDQEFQPVDLLPVVEDAVAQIQPPPQAAHAQITVQADSPLPPVLGQCERLKQVLLNLLENALKYGGIENQIQVTLRVHSGPVHCQVCD